MKKAFLPFLIFFGLQSSFAQDFGNEWIDHSQPYHKVQISEDGMYRLTHDYLQQNGVAITGVKTSGIQLFYRGKEQAIQVSDDGDGLFNSSDYILFYGLKNDGALDASLYKSPSDQPHTHISIFSDTSVYMLTWNDSKTGQRITEYNNPDYSGTSDSFINYTHRLVFEEEWYDGMLNLDHSDQSLGSQGEGYMSSRITTRPRLILMSAPYFTDWGTNPTLRIKLHGRSNPDIFQGGKNHVLEIMEISANRVLEVVKENGYYQKDKTYEMFPSEMSNRVILRFESQASNFDNSAISLMELNYTRDLNLDNAMSFRFKHDGGTLMKFNGVNALSNELMLFDISRNTLIKGSITSDSVFYNLKYKGQSELSEYYLYDTSQIVNYTGGLVKAKFLNVDPSGEYQYLIVSHNKLKSAAAKYEQYRQSTEGRSFKTLLVTTDQLYNEFFYGYHHPLAIKNFCRYYYQSQTTPPEFLLLLGKGALYPQMKDPGVLSSADLVPTIGFPPSDNLLVAGLGSNVGDLSIDLPVGRIPADQSQEVLDYLDKLKAYELNLNAPYKKEILHIAGGSSDAQNSGFQKSLTDYYDLFKTKEFGGWRTMVSKTTANTVSYEHKETIQAKINEGVSMVTYFGHGSSNILDVDIGEASTLNNNGKYPIFYFNGCVLGNTFSTNSLCEQYLFEPGKGSIAWMASTAVGLSTYLDDYATDFHRIAFRQDYGKTLGEWIAKTTKNYLNQGSLYNERQTTQFVLHGDPAIQLFDASLPDFTLEQGGIHIKETALTIAENDSLTLILPAFNLGKATDDTLTVNVRVQNSSGTDYYFNAKRYFDIHSQAQLEFGINIKKLAVSGLVKFFIELDSANLVAEHGSMGELNNSFSYEYFLSLTGVETLFPIENSIVNKTKITLQAQNSNLFAGEVGYYIELDTTPEFNSPNVQKSGLRRASNILEYEFNLLPVDSVDYFWRCRLDLPMDEGGDWNVSTFSLIYGSPEGWSQGYYTKFQKAQLNGVLMDSSSRQWDFTRVVADPIQIVTAVNWSVAVKSGRKFTTHHLFASCDWSNYNGLELLAINPDNEWRYDEQNNPYNRKAYATWCGSGPPGFEKFYTPDSTSGEYRYNTTDSIQRDSLIAFLNRIPEGYHLMVKSGFTMGIENWETDVFEAFEKFGIIGLKDQKEFQPFAIFGQKGSALGSAQEHYADTTLGISPDNQVINVAKLISVKGTAGTIKSPRIGPASKWRSAHFYVDGRDHPSEITEFIVWGINQNDSLVELARNNSGNFSLNTVSVEDYPFLQLEAIFSDGRNRTSAQLNRWTVLFDGIPEGTLAPDIAFEVYNDTLDQGDSLRVKMAFQNLTRFDMDSLLVHFELKNDVYQYDSAVRLDSLKALDHVIIEHFFDTKQIDSDVKLKLSVNPDFDQEEMTLNNNVFFKNISIKEDKKNPILDVVFDGVHIMNLDIVSPKPVITVSANDDNTHLLLDDISLFTLKLRNVNDQQFTTIDLSGPEITFTPQTSIEKNAIVEFRPDQLASGTYELVAQVEDRTGNAQPNEYSIRFQIISESKISNVYPYPNPFTTQTRFVFTLTGEVIPEDMSITIMNVRGQVVKEISALELGPLRIGTNITDFAWDGTDNFGDKLANGVYFYRVNMGKDQANFEHFDTSADALEAFKHDLGKLYIAR